ncbi:MAG: hypothetical protein OEX77_00205 [Candidatus Bathyarchaeota archaeon]|nr:hypothetical protein [Candidatus Bathyarchaeota archaeon]MDH5732234.1 hypothetical protein [Candidatus Bathyarchaeota archaeon]
MLEKSEILGYTVILIGIGLLVFTFVNAYLFLGEKLSILSTNLVEAFGEILGPLIETSIRVMYLGIMGWIGSIITMRGIQILTQTRQEAKQRETRTRNQTSNE